MNDLMAAAPSDQDLHEAWQQRDFGRLGAWICPAADDHEAWISGAWQEPARSLISRSYQSDEKLLDDLVALAEEVHRRLWREGTAFQPGWWRDMMVPELLQYMNGEAYQTEAWRRPALWDSPRRLPVGWREVEPWLQGWTDSLLAYYLRVPEARRGGDRLGFFAPLRNGYVPVAHFLITLRLVNRSAKALLAQPASVCFVREVYTHLVEVALDGKRNPDEMEQVGVTQLWATTVATIVRALSDNHPSEPDCGDGQSSFSGLKQKVRAAGLID